MNRLRAATLALLFSSAVAAVVGACSNQGEGERCEVLNGNEDCRTDEGLICYRAADLNNTVSDRCCPADRTRATHPVCRTPIIIGAEDASAPPDTGPSPEEPDASESDAGSDAAEPADADTPDADDGGG